jgi:hypothetical protein
MTTMARFDLPEPNAHLAIVLLSGGRTPYVTYIENNGGFSTGHYHEKLGAAWSDFVERVTSHLDLDDDE